MTDAETLRTYAAKAAEYADVTGPVIAKDPVFAAFLEEVSPGGHILDLGCGPGLFAGAMAARGFKVTATDAVPEMVEMANTHHGVTAQVTAFDDIKGIDIFDGIWANFSLLHAPRNAMPRHLAALHQALKPGGTFHIALKTGTGEKRDTIGRLYTYYTDAELTDLVAQAGFTVTDRNTGRDKGLDGTYADWIALRAYG
ncbi:Methyltransferase type 11 [Sulfitobacter noctilucae]|uniref:class I SAM-dependent methyltransferase n=1 Tax=Sulfitobacter noctilucae TaxID=1342302 RepID=UPI00046AE29F|nr:class I SAM-dependent methyltransferase [Sulfitobacter noctilucae]KIN65284.1 Methyltransferase type 11 [Sulfitobacter noctilucae]